MSTLLEKIAAGCTVLTVNSRLALHLHKDFERWQQQQGSSCWVTPEILPLNAWLQRQWQEAQFQHAGLLPALLSAEESLAVWEAVIFSSPQGDMLLNTQTTARSAMQAWRLLQQWNLSGETLAHEAHPDSAAFYRWAKEFRARCEKEHWLDQDSLPGWLITALNGNRLKLSGRFLLLGFDELTPQHQKLIAVLQSKVATVEQVELQQNSSEVFIQACADSETEIRQVALWLRHLLQAEEQGPIGVVVPDLASLRGDIERVFDEVLLPEAALDLQHKPKRPYNISLGEPMAHLPVIHAALTLLDLVRGAAALANWSRLLLSPWLGGGDQELTQRARLDAQLRRHGEASLSLKQVLYRNA